MGTLTRPLPIRNSCIRHCSVRIVNLGLENQSDAQLTQESQNKINPRNFGFQSEGLCSYNVMGYNQNSRANQWNVTR